MADLFVYAEEAGFEGAWGSGGAAGVVGRGRFGREDFDEFVVGEGEFVDVVADFRWDGREEEVGGSAGLVDEGGGVGFFSLFVLFVVS